LELAVSRISGHILDEMKSKSIGSMILVIAWFAVATVTPRVTAGQIAMPGDLDPGGRVYTQIIARVGVEGTFSPAISGVTFYIVSVDGHRVILKTNAGGTAATWLPRAQYRIVSPDPFQWEGRLYTWDTVATVRGGMLPVRLNLANGRSKEVPVVTWRPGDSNSLETIKDGQLVRSLSYDGVAAGASVTRSHDLLWVEVIISNRSNRRVAVEPQAFMLSEVSPTRVPLQHRVVTGSVAHPLVTDTLKSGQEVSGVVTFESDKKAKDVLLRIPLSGITFDLPLSIR
jgi:hypothetical protein